MHDAGASAMKTGLAQVVQRSGTQAAMGREMGRFARLGAGGGGRRCLKVLRILAGLTEDRQSRHGRYEALEGEVYAREPISPGCPVCQLLGRGDE